MRLLALLLLLGACTSGCSKPSPPPVVETDATPPVPPFTVLIKEGPPVLWVTEDEDAVVYATGAAADQPMTVRRLYPATGAQLEVVSLSRRVPFAIGGDAYWHASPTSPSELVRLPKGQGGPQSLGKLPGEIQELAVSGGEVLVLTSPIWDHQAEARVSPHEEGHAPNPLAVKAAALGGGIYSIKPGDKKPVRLALTGAAEQLAVTPTQVLWLEPLPHRLFALARGTDAGAATPIDGAVLGFRADARGIVAVRGDAARADLLELPPSGQLVTLASGEAQLEIAHLDASEVVFSTRSGVRRVARGGGGAVPVRVPEAKLRGWAVLGDAVYVGANGQVNGEPVQGLVRVQK